MWIRPNQTFKEGTATFFAGRDYEVSDAEGHYFIRVGWAYALDGQGNVVPPEGVAVQTQSPTLNVPEAQLGVVTREG
jgi:hypothetical protein